MCGVVDFEKRNPMSVVELAELDEVKGLLAKGQQVGVLSYAEISKAMSELDLDESDVEELHGFLEKAEIELVEDIDPATAASSQVERAPDKRGRRKAKAQLDLKPDMTTNSMRSRRWSSRTCAWSFRSPRTTATRACRFST